MDTIIDFLYKLDQQQSKNEEENGKEENFLCLKVTEKNVEQLLLASDLLIISKVEENCLRFQGGYITTFDDRYSIFILQHFILIS